MPLRYLLGPVAEPRASLWSAQRESGACRTFHGSDGAADLRVGPGDGWEDILARLPEGWRPDVLVLDLAYTTVPQRLWDVPVPIVALAPDWPLQWHFLREALPRCELALTDAAGVRALRAAGIPHAERANLFGLQGVFLSGPPEREARRDIDVLFVGNLHPPVQRERLAWLGRIARLSPRWGVHVATGVRGEDYRALLLRSRVAFNRSMRGEWNLRAGEAASCGALLFSERGNEEMAGVWEHGRDCVTYGDDDLEDLLEHYLTHEDERRAVADAGARVAREWTFDASWGRVVRDIEAGLDGMRRRVPLRPAPSPARRLMARAWQALGASDAGDPTLASDLDGAAAAGGEPVPPLLVACGVVTALRRDPPGREDDRPRDSARHFHRAAGVAPGHALAALGLVECLAGMGHPEMAAEGARRLLGRLAGGVAPEDLEGPPYPPGYTLLRVEWERAAWANAGSPSREARDKVGLLRWRLHALLGSIAGDLTHYHEAALARPDLPPSRAALGCALARAGRLAEAVPHLEFACRADPFDAAAARALYQALLDGGHAGAAARSRRERLGLHLAAPGVVPPEAWFARAPQAPPAGGPRPSPPAGLAVVWQGPLRERHSLAGVNRALCRRLAGRGHELSLAPVATPGPMIPPGPEWDSFADRLAVPLSRPADAEVRHAWPPDWTPPPAGHWVVMQPWEYGSVPREWVAPLRDLVDELWVPATSVRDAFVAGGVPADRVHIIPHGVDAALFRPGLPPLPLPTAKGYKFLFVGGTIRRKGIDVLLDAYGAAFTAADDVCLVVKDAGGGSFYKGQTAGETIRAFRDRAGAPEVVHLEDDLDDAEMAALYNACDCLTQPYRGEGFCLPAAEAMACGLPVVVTGRGAALDFCDPETGYLVPAREVSPPERRVAHLETVDSPTLAEPDAAALADILRGVVADPEEARRKGEAGRQRVVERLTWDRAAALVEARLLALRGTPVRRLRVAPTAPPRPAAPAPGPPRPLLPGVSLCVIARDEEANLPDCLAGAAGLFDEVVVVDTGSADRTREVALSLGARVFEFPWVDDFAAARNAALGHASREWIFWLDADDRLDGENRDRLRRLFAELPAGNAAFSMKCVCDSADGSLTVVDHIRLFRNDPRIRWRYRIHEQILGAVRDAGGEVRWADVSIRHTGYVDPALKARKRKRDLRLLEAEHREQPHDPFTLFNLGATYQEAGRHAEALPLLRESLARSHPADSIVRKLYSLVSLSLLNTDLPDEAVRACRDGQAVCPNDAELLFLEGALLTDAGDLQGAKAALVRLLGTEPGRHFASVTDGLRGHKGRHQLALVCLRLGEHHEAESLWRAVLRERPNHAPAWLGLGELYSAQARWPEFWEATDSLSRSPGGGLDAALLSARAHRIRREFSAGRRLLAEARERWPGEVGVLVGLSHLLLEEDHDHAEAERVLEEVLRLAPGHAQARSNLEALRSRTGGGRDAAFLGDFGLGQVYLGACRADSDVAALLPALYDLARRSPRVTALGGCGGGVAAALLYARPDRLAWYGGDDPAEAGRLLGLRGPTDADIGACPPPGGSVRADLLVIDARGGGWPGAESCREAAEVAERVGVLGEARDGGETSGVVEEWLRLGTFRLGRRIDAGAGLSILERP